MTNKENMKYIIDVDTGIDDALALLVASKKIADKVIGITTCGGNVAVNDATSNTLKIAQLANWNVPIYHGAAKSIEGNEFVHAYDYHGSNGICDVRLDTKRTAEKTDADRFIIDNANQFDLTIICLASPTNLARALIKSPEISNRIKNVYLMGGALNVSGNQTEYAEFNFFQDPHAVKVVLENIQNVFIIPLDVTNQCCITDSEAAGISSHMPMLMFLKEAVSNWYRFFGYQKKRQFELYDPLALSAAIGEDFVGFNDAKIGINTEGLRAGEIFINGKYPVKIAQSVRAADFKKDFLESLS